MLEQYLECVLLEKLEGYPEDIRCAFWAEIFDETGCELWGGADFLKDEVKQILDWMDLDAQFRHAVWWSINWEALIARMRAAWMEERDYLKATPDAV